MSILSIRRNQGQLLINFSRSRYGVVGNLLLVFLLGPVAFVAATCTLDRFAAESGISYASGTVQLETDKGQQPVSSYSPASSPFNPATCALASHYFVPEIYPGTSVQCDQAAQHCTGRVGDRLGLDLMVHPPEGGDPSGITAQQAYINFDNGTQDYLRVQNIRRSTAQTSCVLTSTVTHDLNYFDAPLQNEICNNPAGCTFRGVPFGPGHFAYASGVLSNGPYMDSADFRVAQTAWCLSQTGRATLRWQFAPPDPLTRDTQIINGDGNLVANRNCYVDFIIDIVPPPTSTPSHTFMPSHTLTSEPTPTGIYCSTGNPSSSTTCTPPSTFRATFTFGTQCYMGHNGTYGYYTVYFQVADNSGWPWNTIDQQFEPSASFPEGLVDYTHTFVENNIPPQYSLYRMVLDGYARSPGGFWNPIYGETPATLICAPTPTPTVTRTPTRTPTSTPLPVLVGHVIWQGITQPNAQNLGITGTLTLCSAGVPYSFTPTSDAGGQFTVTTGLPNGIYDWLFKGPKWLASSGTVALSGNTNKEFGIQRAGDANNDNIISVTDYNIVRSAFGKQPGDPGYDSRADFNNNGVCNAVDFNLLRGNFGHAGATPGCSSRR